MFMTLLRAINDATLRRRAATRARWAPKRESGLYAVLDRGGERTFAFYGRSTYAPDVCGWWITGVPGCHADERLRRVGPRVRYPAALWDEGFRADLWLEAVRPIETAPRDGTQLLLFRVRDGEIDDVDVGGWEVYGGRDDPGGYDPPFSDWTSLRGIEEPTHWLPLPGVSK